MQNNHLVVGASDLSYGTFQCQNFQLPIIDNKSSTRLPYAVAIFYFLPLPYEKFSHVNGFLKVNWNKE